MFALLRLLIIITPFVLIGLLIFFSIRGIYRNATSDNLHFIVMGGFALILFGPWYGTKNFNQGSLLFNVGLLILIANSVILVISSYRDTMNENDQPLFLQSIVTSLAIFGVNYFCGHFMFNMENEYNNEFAQAHIQPIFTNPAKYQALTVGSHQLIITLVSIFLMSVLASKGSKNYIYDHILDPIYDHFHPDYDNYDDEEIKEKPKPSNDINIDKIKKKLTPHKHQSLIFQMTTMIP